MESDAIKYDSMVFDKPRNRVPACCRVVENPEQLGESLENAELWRTKAGTDR